jgi:hypothetical protein
MEAAGQKGLSPSSAWVLSADLAPFYAVRLRAAQAQSMWLLPSRDKRAFPPALTRRPLRTEAVAQTRRPEIHSEVDAS